MAVAAAVEAGGWEADVQSSRRGRNWCVTAEQSGVVTSPGTVRQARLFFEDIVSRIPGAAYDGWHASVNEPGRMRD